MSGNVKAWPIPAGRADVPAPTPISRPCDAGLCLAIMNLEVQLGTVEAYNRLATQAHLLKEKIDAGKAEPQNQLYAANPSGG